MIKQKNKERYCSVVKNISETACRKKERKITVRKLQYLYVLVLILFFSTFYFSSSHSLLVQFLESPRFNVQSSLLSVPTQTENGLFWRFSILDLLGPWKFWFSLLRRILFLLFQFGETIRQCKGGEGNEVTDKGTTSFTDP